VLAIAQLNGFGGGGVLLGPLRHVAITNDPGGEAYAYWQYLEAHALKNMPQDEQAKRIDKGALTLDRFQQSVAATSYDFFRGLLGDFQLIKAELDRLDALLEDRLAMEFRPSFSALREQLDDIERAVRSVAPVDSPMEEGLNGQAQGVGGPGGISVGGIHSREEAFRQLAVIADFFEKTEPLSLLAEQIRKIVRLGRMNPLEYFSELIDNDDTRRQMFRLVGIKREE
jgi:type VI secretion system protein ImpA